MAGVFDVHGRPGREMLRIDAGRDGHAVPSPQWEADSWKGPGGSLGGTGGRLLPWCVAQGVQLSLEAWQACCSHGCASGLRCVLTL